MVPSKPPTAPEKIQALEAPESLMLPRKSYHNNSSQPVRSPRSPAWNEDDELKKSPFLESQILLESHLSEETKGTGSPSWNEDFGVEVSTLRKSQTIRDQSLESAPPFPLDGTSSPPWNEYFELEISPLLNPQTVRDQPLDSPPPFPLEEIMPHNKKRRKRTQPSLGDTVLLSFLDPNRPNLARTAGELALNSPSSSEEDGDND
jgi:hypothetical protein